MHLPLKPFLGPKAEDWPFQSRSNNSALPVKVGTLVSTQIPALYLMGFTEPPLVSTSSPVKWGVNTWKVPGTLWGLDK